MFAFYYMSVFQGVLVGVLTLAGLYILYKLLPTVISFFSHKITGQK